MHTPSKPPVPVYGYAFLAFSAIMMRILKFVKHKRQKAAEPAPECATYKTGAPLGAGGGLFDEGHAVVAAPLADCSIVLPD